MKEYTATVSIEMNVQMESESKEEFKESVKTLFLEEFNINDLTDEEITDISVKT